MEKRELIIVGNGPAGCTAAIYAARAGLRPLVYCGPVPGGLLTQTSEVENFPGFPEGISGFDLMMAMQSQAERFGAEFEFEAVEKFQLTDGGDQTLILADGSRTVARALIVATGAAPRYLGLPAEERLRNHGVSACATCDGAFYRDVPVVVVGGGDSAMEEAIFLTRFASRVHLIHRRDKLRASTIMAERAKANPKISFELSSQVVDILGDKAVEGVEIESTVDGSRRRIECRGYFAALGHVPNTEAVKEFVATDAKGYIVLDGASSRTTLKGVFAAGDCADPHYRQAIAAAGSGCRAAMDAERYCTGE